MDPDLPGADIRIGYARCSTLGQELDSQPDALAGHGIPREKIFSEKTSTCVRVRPRFEEALRTAREVKVAGPPSSPTTCSDAARGESPLSRSSPT
ncbi:recombinase family protein [Streptomyces sp. NPDC058412]|uniref:recombinase family protein n=1 Tax=Streptomyces sp. NPDC058412 TaxID=3346486 RepID=UPI00364F62C8